MQLDYDYCEEPEHAAKFYSELRNWSEELGHKNYTMKVTGIHEASEFNLDFDSSIFIKNSKYKVEATGRYKRGYLPEMELELDLQLDYSNKQIKIFVSKLIFNYF